MDKHVGNIAKYDVRVKDPENKLGEDKSRYQQEKARLQSFKNWPFYAQGLYLRQLLAAGFVFTGTLKFLKYFSGVLCLGSVFRLQSFVNFLSLVKTPQLGIRSILLKFNLSNFSFILWLVQCVTLPNAYKITKLLSLIFGL